MVKHAKDQQAKHTHTQPPPSEEANRQRQQAEPKKVAGRHKNDGQKGHKGAQ